MLGAGRSGAMQLRGRTSVVPAGHVSPCWIVVTGPPRPPGRPVCALVAPARIERMLTPAITDLPCMETPLEIGMRQSVAGATQRELPPTIRRRWMSVNLSSIGSFHECARGEVADAQGGDAEGRR